MENWKKYLLSEQIDRNKINTSQKNFKEMQKRAAEIYFKLTKKKINGSISILQNKEGKTTINGVAVPGNLEDYLRTGKKPPQFKQVSGIDRDKALRTADELFTKGRKVLDSDSSKPYAYKMILQGTMLRVYAEGLDGNINDKFKEQQIRNIKTVLDAAKVAKPNYTPLIKAIFSGQLPHVVKLLDKIFKNQK